MFRKLLAAGLGAAALTSGTLTGAVASNPAAMDASPELQSYQCGLFSVQKTWTVVVAGSSWSVTYGDGGSSGTLPISTKSITHTFSPMGSCRDYNQLFTARDTFGGTATDGTRVVYTH